MIIILKLSSQTLTKGNLILMAKIFRWTILYAKIKMVNLKMNVPCQIYLRKDRPWWCTTVNILASGNDATKEGVYSTQPVIFSTVPSLDVFLQPISRIHLFRNFRQVGPGLSLRTIAS